MGHGCSWAWESLLPSSNSLHAFLELFSSVHPNHNLPSVCSQRHQQKPVSKMRFGSLPSKHSRRADMEVLLLFVSLLQGESPENSAGTKGSCWRFAASHHYGAGQPGLVDLCLWHPIWVGEDSPSTGVSTSLINVLLPSFPKESASSTLYGPRFLTGAVGGSITHQCFYSITPANKYDRKFWCKRDRDGICYTIISTTNFISKNHMGRVALEDVPQHGTFMVTMTQLKTSDTGTYRCGIGPTNRDLYVSLNLTVSAGTVMGQGGCQVPFATLCFKQSWA